MLWGLPWGSHWGKTSTLVGPDHVAASLARIIEQFKTKTTLTDMLVLVSERWVTVEQALDDLINERSLDTANGTQLDVIGSIVNHLRQGSTDAVYRARLRTWIANVMMGSGTIPNILGLVSDLLADAREITYLEFYPAGFIVWAEDVLPDELAIWASMLAMTHPAGVEANFVTYASTGAFGFEDSDAAHLGFSSVYDTNRGGKLAHAVDM